MSVPTVSPFSPFEIEVVYTKGFPVQETQVLSVSSYKDIEEAYEKFSLIGHEDGSSEGFYDFFCTQCNDWSRYCPNFISYFSVRS